MTGTAIPEIPHFGITTAVLSGELPKGEAPPWIKVTPRGLTETRDWRALKLNFSPELLADRFKAEGVDLPLDLDHAIALGSANAGAIGWVKDIQARDDGTYARMEWLSAGRTAIASRTHRYVSPSVYHLKQVNAAGFHDVTGMHSISLVPAPALTMPALLAARKVTAPGTVREALGLDASADEEACVAAIRALSADFVPTTLFADAVAALNLSQLSTTKLRSEARRGEVESFLDGALRDGKIYPAERAQYLAMCATEAGFANVKALCAVKVPHHLFTSSGLDGPPLESDSETASQLAARATRYRDQQTKLGIELTQSEAIAYAHVNPRAGR